MELTIPRLIVSSYKGKSGKTLVTLAIAYALSKAGFTPSLFKTGPDYIDASLHGLITGSPSRNLDYVLMGYGIVERLHRYSRGSDIALIEGVAGLYDSPSGIDEYGSTAQLSKILKAPVLLVINGERINRTAGALVRGLRQFDPDVKLIGAVLTNVASRQVDKLSRIIEEEGLPVVGFIPRDEEVEEVFKYRHLGLMHAREVDEEWLMNVIEKASAHINVEAVLKLAKEQSEPVKLSLSINDTIPIIKGVPRIGIMTGRAFTFYYPETIEEAYTLGDVKFIDPERDGELGDIDILLIGGGFPEIYASGLEGNRALKSSVRKFIERGGYLYAECGGLMYLTNSIIFNNNEYEMVGAIDASTIMLSKPIGHGYASAMVIKDTPIAPRGTVLKGHEFHYSKLILKGNYELALEYERGFGVNGKDGFLINNAYAHYLHIHPYTYSVLNSIVKSWSLNPTSQP
ncbi:cobyrinate a,c-diamide synthase [Caldivirga maquilingensis]|uniref:Cobyrinic acid a,c-diamide synthase n=1 Tax=Caldivirga maquilingensis (strain ATCC 700844 / DSM 13496 / JCM 10307 / IC-167) TaxID=397948 RepID=A8ME49_CALMQ|nr:cobyrinate a,c-diamide synthase [Caldivirga maquilingensis]ABW02055.1 cobyrinic acid a,c-diamide synthase [Caldivirga maquilingensis IC-167]